MRVRTVKYFLLLIIIFFFGRSLGQSQGASARFFDMQDKKLQHLDSLYHRYFYTHPQLVKQLAIKGLHEAIRNLNYPEKIKFYQYLSQIDCILGYYLQAIDAQYKILLNYEIYNNTQKFYEQIVSLARCYYKSDLSDDYLLHNLNKAIAYFKKHRDTANLILAWAYKVYLDHNLSKKKRQQILKNLFQAVEKFQNMEVARQAFVIVADYYYKQGDYIQALSFLKKAQWFAAHLSSYYYERIKYKIVNIYLTTGNYYAAQNLISEPLKYFSSRSDVVNTAFGYYLQARISNSLLNYVLAISQAHRALQMSKQYNIVFVSMLAYKLLSQLYIQIQKPDLSYFSYSKYVALRDSVYSINNFYQISNSQLKLSMLVKEKENLKLETEKKYEELKRRQQTLISLFLGLVLVVILFALIFLALLLRINKQSLERLKNFTQVSQEGIIIYGSNSVRDFNDKFLQLTGYTPEEARKLTLMDLFDEDIAKNILLSSENLLIETRVKRKDGSVFLATVASRPFHYSKIKSQKAISIHDVTDIRKTEYELIKSQQRFRVLIDTLPDVIIITTASGIINYISSSAIKMFKIEDVSQYLNRSILGFLDIEQKQKLAHIIRSLSMEFEYQTHEFEYKRRDGSIIYLECRCSAVRDRRGAVTDMIFALRDITKRHEFEELLRKREQKFRSLFYNANDGIMLVDKNGVIREINDSVAKILQYGKEQILYRNLLDFIPENLRKRLQLNHILAPNKKFETPMIVSNGRLIYVQITVSLINEQDEQLYLLILRDITDMRQSQEKLQKLANKLRESNEAKVKLFSIIAHDLRGPIGNWKAMLEMILDDNFEFNQEELRQILSELKQSSVTTFEFLDNLLSWARSQLNQIDYKPEQINLYDLVEEILGIFQSQAKIKQIQLSNMIDNADLKVFADREMLKVVLRNLVSNALKFTPRGGSIRIKSFYDKDMVIVAVEDTGIGIPQDRLMMIFEDNKFVSTSGTEYEKGTGLGLHIVKDFVERNKGRIWVESVLGRGTIFYFSVPRV